MATAIEQIQAAAANWSIEVTPTGATNDRELPRLSE